MRGPENVIVRGTGLVSEKTSRGSPLDNERGVRREKLRDVENMHKSLARQIVGTSVSILISYIYLWCQKNLCTFQERKKLKIVIVNIYQ